MKYRKLRIAWSVAWGVVAVLLCVLWVRSYWRYDWLGALTFFPRQSKGVEVTGGCLFESENGGLGITYAGRLWELLPDLYDIGSISLDDPNLRPTTRGVYPNGTLHGTVPHWCLLSAAIAISTFPWLRWRFSLRTLLIATTVIAVALGMIAWMSRAG